MINLSLLSEYSFQRAFAPLDKLVSSQDGDTVGVADFDNTYSHYKFQKECLDHNKKPIFGARVMAVRDPTEKVRPRGQFGPIYILLAKNHEGLVEIYDIVSKSTKMFYYRCQVGLVDIWRLSENVIVICEGYEIAERIDYLGVSFKTPKHLLEGSTLPRVAIQNNKYITADDAKIYEIFSGRKRDINTYPNHILSEREWLAYFKDRDAVNNTYEIAEQCNVKLKTSRLIKYDKDEDIVEICKQGAKDLDVDLADPIYKERFEREMTLIKEKDFVDYFLIVGDMVRSAKETMLVGPGRGSSGGSLVCYLMKITVMDPIKYGLLFERFINPTRLDLPDIDVDFPDKHREKVIQRLIDRYGKERVRHLGIVSCMKPKGTIRDFAKEFNIPEYEIDKVSKEVITRSTGDARYSNCINDTLRETVSGKALLEKYPEMEICGEVEGHAKNSGIHAAAVIVSDAPLNHFGSIDERKNALMLEKVDTKLNDLLKIDCLGLKTLTILQDTAEMAGFDFHDYYKLEFNDDNVFKLFRDVHTKGIFQFEGYALQNLCRTIKVRSIDDISAINALSRPGPLHGGSTSKFSEMHSGNAEPEPIVDHPIVRRITDPTLGNLVYQEQIMEIARELAGFDPKGVAEIRILISTRSGTQKFENMREEFVEGSVKNGLERELAEHLWEKMVIFGTYGFNKSHALAYSFLSYWTAWAKRYYPLEFTCAFLNNTGDIDDKKKLIRTMIEEFDVEIIPFDDDLSGVKWEIKDGKVVGPLTNIKGIGIAGARKIVKCRETDKMPPKGLLKKLIHQDNEFSVLFPCQEYWGDFFDDPDYYKLPRRPTLIKKVLTKGEYIIIGRLIKRNVRDLNEESNVRKRGGEVFETDTYLLNINVEDDTDSIICRISRHKFKEMGVPIIKYGREGTDWYLIKGNIISDDIRMLFINSIHCLGDGINETIEDIEV